MPFVPATFGRLDPYWGTFVIDWSMPFVPATFGRLDPYWGTFVTVSYTHLTLPTKRIV